MRGLARTAVRAPRGASPRPACSRNRSLIDDRNVTRPPFRCAAFSPIHPAARPSVPSRSVELGGEVAGLALLVPLAGLFAQFQSSSARGPPDARAVVRAESERTHSSARGGQQGQLRSLRTTTKAQAGRTGAQRVVVLPELQHTTQRISHPCSPPQQRNGGPHLLARGEVLSLGVRASVVVLQHPHSTVSHRSSRPLAASRFSSLRC